MKNKVNAKTRQQIASELNISRTTLYRVLKRKGMTIPKGLIYKNDQEKIYESLGCIRMKQNETK